ncbi:HNH endonuclease [Sediminibacillus massiliensis]|uniref:HNH endonuclease n=1 Tax=Sediminibacillus massiliensis TaxID=1926277 RepID=UPI00098867EF|nr:HNH endonuclease [Sediminibacillus massiliensis]
MAKTIEVKKCSRCHQEKPIEQFYGEKRSHCQDCEKEQKREYHGGLRGKAAQALQDARKARRKVEAETGESIKDDLTLPQVALALSSGECAYCLQDIPISERSLDHITPMRYGGSNTFDNVICSCKSCNSGKSDLPAVLFMIQSCDSWANKRLIDRVASRSNQTFYEAFEMLTESVKTYFQKQAEEAKAQAEGGV